MDARLGLRIRQSELDPAILIVAALFRDLVEALNRHNLEWIVGCGLPHFVAKPDVVAGICKRQHHQRNNEYSFHDGEEAIHAEREWLRRNSGVGDGVRTHDPRSHSPMFYR